MANIELNEYKLTLAANGLRVLVSELAKTTTKLSVLKDIIILAEQFEAIAKLEAQKPKQ